jgi:DNA sulfur modification protein DndC
MADTLAPLLHWRLCHVYDWLYFDDRHGYDASGIAAIYGEDDVRTGCVGCNLASRDNALERLLRRPEWSHLAPLLELRPLYAELKLAKNRKRKAEPELRKDGTFATNVQRLGPLTMDARRYGLDRVLDIQRRAGVDLINDEEIARILELIAADTWPNKWSGDDIAGDKMLDAVSVTTLGDLVTQPILVHL